MPQVFTADFVSELERRYAIRPAWSRPDVYFVATSPKRAEHRAWIEVQVDALDQDARAKVIPRLRGDDHFITTFHELSVLAVLRDAGLQPRYEATLPGTDLTPDILVDGVRNGAIIDVWTRRVADDMRNEARAWRELRERLRPIPSSLGVRVEPIERDVDFPPPTAARAKELVRALRPWLLSVTTTKGCTFEDPPYRFVVVVEQLGMQTGLAHPRSGGWVSTEDLLAGIRSKSRRYATLARNRGLSLVVALAAETVPVDTDLLRTALAGRQAFSASFSPLDSDLIAEETVTLRPDETPPPMDSSLSAIAWLAAPGPAPMLEIFPNPAAAKPIAWPDTISMMTLTS